MKKNQLGIIGLLGFFLFFGCQLENVDETVVVSKPKTEETEVEPEKTDMESPAELDIDERKWTVMVYMAADNNLESSALEDIYEMECSKLNTKAVTVLVLIDRTPSYDASNNNWSGTRLYRIEAGRSSDSKELISEQIECRELGLIVGNEVELDMSSEFTLSSFINYGRKKYPAEHFALIMWGHGTGWRNSNEELYKGFAYDETSKTYMTLHQLGEGLKDGLSDFKLDFLGFDTCFGGELEIMYELKDFAKYCVASEGLIMSSGWNYQQLFTDFQQNGEASAEKFVEAVVNQFKKQYGNSYRASICVVQMDKVNELFIEFDNYCKKIADGITDEATRDEIMKKIYSGKECKTEKYTYGTAGNDIYIDIVSMAEQIGGAEKFLDIEKQAVINSWAADRDRGGLGVYFCSLVEGNLLSSTMPAAYVKGRTIDQIKFVADSQGYVPCDKNGNGLLDKLFFTSF